LPGTTWTTWGSGRVPVGVDTSQTEFNTVEKTGGAKTHTLVVNEMPSHSHDMPTGNGGSGSVWGYENRGCETTWTGNTDTTGNGQPHNNLQPYITCYMWKRTT
jgi:microcystin-dependent protein